MAAVGQLLPTHAYADTSWQIAGDSLALRIIDQGHPGQILHVVPHHRTLDLPRRAARAIVATIRAEYLLALTVETADEILPEHREA